jgi:hypothetical protein
MLWTTLLIFVLRMPIFHHELGAKTYRACLSHLLAQPFLNLDLKTYLCIVVNLVHTNTKINILVSSTLYYQGTTSTLQAALGLLFSGFSRFWGKIKIRARGRRKAAWAAARARAVHAT